MSGRAQREGAGRQAACASPGPGGIQAAAAIVGAAGFGLNLRVAAQGMREAEQAGLIGVAATGSGGRRQQAAGALCGTAG